MNIIWKRKLRKASRLGVSHLILIAGSVLMLFPLVWLFFSSFKSSNQIFTKEFSLLPKTITFENYLKGWYTNPEYSFDHFMLNTLRLTVEELVGTLFSCTLTAFAFAKLKFPGRNFWFAVMLLTMMIPGQVTMIPTYILFTKLGWLNTHWPFIAPAFTATSSFYVFMLVQFMRTIPEELSEAAKIDGCSNLRLYSQIVMPLCRNSIFTVIIFSIMGTWNEYMKPLLYLNKVRSYTLSMVIKSIVDSTEPASWGNLMAMSVVSLLPCIIIFFCAQSYFMEGIATTGMKG